MKKTNVALLQNVRLLRVLSLVIALFVVSATQLSAQSFLPLEDAAPLVKQAIQDKQEIVATVRVDITNPNDISPSTLQSVFTSKYLTLYINKADELNSVEDALGEIDRLYNSSKAQNPMHKDMIVSARAELMDLITE